jgi:hypothetical protein
MTYLEYSSQLGLGVLEDLADIMADGSGGRDVIFRMAGLEEIQKVLVLGNGKRTSTLRAPKSEFTAGKGLRKQ